MQPSARLTVAHVTHEAVEKIGGIGTVLEGMITAPAYQQAVGRTFLIGPTGGHHFEGPLRRLGGSARITYSSRDGIDTRDLGRRLRPVEYAFGVSLIVADRVLTDEATGRHATTELILVNVDSVNRDRLNGFKTRIWERFGIDCARHEADWGFEEYCRLAEPAFYALSALLSAPEQPCIVVSHEFMGVCTGLKCVLDGNGAFRTIFHAHECSTARRLVEEHEAHDLAFYTIMRQAMREGKSVGDVFGDQSFAMRHDLISHTHEFDAIMAVGDETAREMNFLSPAMRQAHVDLVYNGVPSYAADGARVTESRRQFDSWSESALGLRADVLMTHVCRPVASKAMWRDLMVAARLDEAFGERGWMGLLLFLVCGAPPRSREDVTRMAQEYGWPLHHRHGYPDLVGPEIEIAEQAARFNAHHANIRAVVVNQFGWSAETIGPAVPSGMTLTDLRLAAEVEFGLSTYEPFGIAPLEPLAGGAICVVSAVSGCAFAAQAAAGDEAEGLRNVLICDYTNPSSGLTIEEAFALDEGALRSHELEVSAAVAGLLLPRIESLKADPGLYLKSGQGLAERLSWERIVSGSLLPVLERVRKARSKASAQVPGDSAR